MKPLEESKAGSTIEQAANVAEKVIEFTQKHWPKPEEPMGRPPTPPKIPHPPPIRPRMRMKPGGK
jgi:hypothetical protein